MRVVGALATSLRYHLLLFHFYHLFCFASLTPFDFVFFQERRRSRSRSRPRGSDEEELGRSRRSPEAHRRSQREPQTTQPFQEAQWQQGQSSQRPSFSQPPVPEFGSPLDPGSFSAPLSGVPPPLSGLFSVPLYGTMPSPTIPVSLGQSTPLSGWTGPALSLTTTGPAGTSRDATPRTRMVEGLFGSPFPYTQGGPRAQGQDETDSDSRDF